MAYFRPGSRTGLQDMEPPGRVSLAYRGISGLPSSLIERAESVAILDLSHNKFTELHSLKCFTKLKTLVMDDNYITSHTTLPPLPLLDTLWVNQNRISNLALFIEAISSTYPNLRFLSMMKNDAAPSYFNNGSKQDYNEYRYFVVSQLPKLIALDDTQISDEERSKAVQLYGVPRKRSSSVVKKTAKQGKHKNKNPERTPLLEER